MGSPPRRGVERGALRRRVAALGLGVLVAGTSAAASAQPSDDDAPLQPVKINREGEYGGVTPGAAQTAADEKLRRKRARRGKTISWIGLQPRTEGGARLFVQLGDEVAYSQHVVGNVLLIQLDGARLGSRNARRALDVRYFESTVQRIEPKTVSARKAKKDQPKRKAGVELRVEFKNPADAAAAAASTATEQDGYVYIYFDFPAAPAAQGSIAPPKRRLPTDVDGR
jgi:hypothetical protein